MRDDKLCTCGHSEAQHAVGYCEASSYCGCTKFRPSSQTVSERALIDYMHGWTDGATECAKLDGKEYLRGYQDGERSRVLARCAGLKYIFYEIEGHCRRCMGKGGWQHQNPPGSPYQNCPRCKGTGFDLPPDGANVDTKGTAP